MNKFKVGDKVVLSKKFISSYRGWICLALNDNPNNFLGIISKCRSRKTYDFFAYGVNHPDLKKNLNGSVFIEGWYENWFDLKSEKDLKEEDML